MTSIAIIRTGGIGDVILSSVAINIIADALPEAQIYWFGYRPAIELITKAFPEVTTRELDREKGYRYNIDLLKTAAPKMDLVIDLQRSARSMIIGKIIAAYFHSSYITWNKYSVNRTLLVMQSYLKGRLIKGELLKTPLANRHEAMADCVIRGIKKLTGAINTLDNTPCIIAKTGEKSNTVAVNLGALFASKELPMYKVKEILGYLLHQGITGHIIFLGTSDKQEEAERLMAEFEGKVTMENHCGKTTLWEAAQLLSKCAFSISNDTALAHLSESVGTPVVMFFGPTHEKFGYRPYLEYSRSFSVDISCRPCTKGGNTGCRYNDFKCLHDIAMEPVFDHLTALINKKR